MLVSQRVQAIGFSDLQLGYYIHKHTFDESGYPRISFPLVNVYIAMEAMAHLTHL